MDLQNFSGITFFIFLVLLLFSIFLFRYFYISKTKEKLLKTNYKKNLFTEKLSFVFLFISIIIMLFSLFKPAYYIKNTIELKSANIVFLLDVSKSMKAMDYKYDWKYISRLDFAKKSISSYVIANPNNKYSLVIFAWESVSVSPLTSNLESFLIFLSWVDEENLSIQGTNIEEAIKDAISRFTDENQNKNIVMISDFWDENIDFDLDEIQKSQKQKDINFNFIWVWTKTWAYIPEQVDVFWRVIYKRYNWERVITKLNISNMKSISSKLNSNNLVLKTDDKLSNILDIKKENTIEKKDSGYTDLSRYLWFISLFFFILHLVFLIKRKDDLAFKKYLWKK